MLRKVPIWTTLPVNIYNSARWLKKPSSLLLPPFNFLIPAHHPLGMPRRRPLLAGKSRLTLPWGFRDSERLLVAESLHLLVHGLPETFFFLGIWRSRAQETCCSESFSFSKVQDPGVSSWCRGQVRVACLNGAKLLSDHWVCNASNLMKGRTGNSVGKESCT